MPSAPDNTATPPPSIFISYASGDRAAARLLGETLTKAGLDVWLDEEELAGGDAWDAKIRKQIRTCTYFMPVISATTEARREGYFRREWRLAVERTLDHADDVLFLTPVVIDDTREPNARVPEKFTTVQWLRCPGGRETAQLLELARRLAAGPDVAVNVPPPTVAPRGTVPPVVVPEGKKAKRADKPLPPFPPFPSYPEERGKRARFLYDLVLWVGHTVVALWHRLPRWLRVVLTVYIAFRVVSGVFGLFGTSERKASREVTAERIAAAQKVGEKIAESYGAKPAATKANKEASDETANKLLEATRAAIDAFQRGKPLAVVTFSATDAGAQQPALDAFNALNNRLKKAGHDEDVAIGAVPYTKEVDDDTILARAATLQCHWLLVGTAKSTGSDEFTITVRLFDARTRQVVWKDERTADTDAGEATGDALGRELLKHVDFTPAPPEPAKPAATPPTTTEAPPSQAPGK